MIGHQLPLVALIVPLWLVLIIAGWRGAREVWPAIAVTGLAYAITMYLSSTLLGPTLPDILSSIVSLLCLVTLLRYWRPKSVWRFPHEAAAPEHPVSQQRSVWDIARAWTPFLLLIIFIANWALPGPQSLLSRFTAVIPFGELYQAIVANGQTVTVTYSFAWLSAAGTAILFAAILTAILMRMSCRVFLRVVKDTLNELKTALLTIASVVGFAYIANYSGISATLAAALSRQGTYFRFWRHFSVGWAFFLTGSDT